mgnify:CR=1 FL=1|tara:strand:+ start:1287 stop:2927 length:1641 start_codon:yes stop_codon:yes gene_type:complete
MAKKQGINYSPNTALIQGERFARTDFSNAPGVYAGIDEVTKSGLGMIEGVVKEFEAEEKEKQEIEKRWDMTSDQVLLNAGALGDVLYGSTREDIVKLKKMYLEGVNEKDDKKRMQAMIGLQNHSNFIQDHKQVNLDYAKAKTDGTLSSYYTEDPEGRKEAHIIEQISGQKYNKTSRGKDGDTVFHIPAYESEDGVKYEAMDVTSEEYNDMMTPKNFKITAAYTAARSDSYKQENFEEDFFRQKVRNSLPRNKRDWKAAAYDDVSGTNLKEMLRTSGTLDQEILGSINPEQWDLDGNPKTLTNEEREAFIDAVTNTDNKLFNLENSNKIMEDQLVNAGRNSHTTHWRDKNVNNQEENLFGSPTKKDFNSKYGEWVSNAERGRRREFVENNQGFNGLGGSYEYNEKNKTWTLDSGEGPTPINMYDILKDEALLIPGDKRVGAKSGGAKKAQPLNMINEPVEGGLLTNVFMMDDEKAIDQMKLVLPPNFTIKTGTSKAGKFFGVDKVQIISDGGVNLGTFDVGYSDSKKALEESKRFNSNLQDYLIEEL